MNYDSNASDIDDMLSNSLLLQNSLILVNGNNRRGAPVPTFCLPTFGIETFAVFGVNL